MRIAGFEWGETNQAKLELHDLEPESIEELFASGDPLAFRHPERRDRLIALGFVPDGRFVLIVFEYSRKTHWVRVVTAYEPTDPRWWSRYAKAKGLGS
jgi:uncharacterized DUF497 family protein